MIHQLRIVLPSAWRGLAAPRYALPCTRPTTPIGAASVTALASSPSVRGNLCTVVPTLRFRGKHVRPSAFVSAELRRDARVRDEPISRGLSIRQGVRRDWRNACAGNSTNCGPCHPCTVQPVEGRVIFLVAYAERLELYFVRLHFARLPFARLSLARLLQSTRRTRRYASFSYRKHGNASPTLICEIFRQRNHGMVAAWRAGILRYKVDFMEHDYDDDEDDD
eukprot:6174224-Pleurochrysis_carterae.AAC.2